MLALCLMLSVTYYAQNYADIIDCSLSLEIVSYFAFWVPHKARSADYLNDPHVNYVLCSFVSKGFVIIS